MPFKVINNFHSLTTVGVNFLENPHPILDCGLWPTMGDGVIIKPVCNEVRHANNTKDKI